MLQRAYDELTERQAGVEEAFERAGMVAPPPLEFRPLPRDLSTPQRQDKQSTPASTVESTSTPVPKPAAVLSDEGSPPPQKGDIVLATYHDPEDAPTGSSKFHPVPLPAGQGDRGTG